MLQLCQNELNIPSHSFHVFSAGISLAVGRNKERYLMAWAMDLSLGHNMGLQCSSISLVESSEK